MLTLRYRMAKGVRRMRGTLWVVSLGLVALVTTQGCKRKDPEPIPGPKAAVAAGVGMVGRIRTPGIAWFQGSLDEGFARAEHRKAAASPRPELHCSSPAPTRPIPRA